MIFNSYPFLLFFPIVTSLYFLVPHTLRWVILLLASMIFYIAFVPVYIFVLFILIIVDYASGILIQESKGKVRKVFLLLSIFTTVSVLCVFKYANFFNANISEIATLFHLHYPVPMLKLLLPIGLSFHTFQSLGYVIEVYRKKQKAERHLGMYALYVMFYPQLVAGPIERPQHLLPQLRTYHAFSGADAIEGIKRMVLGFFKKVVIADRLGLIANLVYGSPYSYTGTPLLIGTVAFAFQIYYDFSGYSDIAIGSARVMGIRLVENFHYPYFATSIPEFWRRWHCSLYSWFHEYIYIPLGGNRVRSKLMRYRNIMIVFIVSGFWHGAAWTYVMWGVLHGIFVVAYTMSGRFVDSVRIRFPLLSIVTTFILVSFAWIIFRAKTLKDAWYIVTHWYIGLDKPIHGFGKELGVSPYDAWITILCVSSILIFEGLQATKKFVRFPFFVRYAVYISFVLAIMNLGISQKIPFIYFQF